MAADIPSISYHVFTSKREGACVDFLFWTSLNMELLKLTWKQQSKVTNFYLKYTGNTNSTRSFL